MAEPPTSSTASSGLSAGAIAGIVVGSLAAVALVAALVVLAMRRRKAKAKAAEPVLGVVVTKGGTETGSSSDVEGGGGKLMHGSSGEGFAMGSAYEGKPPAGFGGLPAVVQTDSGRTFGTMLVDTDARRLPPTDWNTGEEEVPMALCLTWCCILRCISTAATAVTPGGTPSVEVVDTVLCACPCGDRSCSRLLCLLLSSAYSRNLFPPCASPTTAVLFSELEMDTCIGQGSFGAVWRAKYCSTSGD